MNLHLLTKGFWAALSFLTTLPAPAQHDQGAEVQGASLLCYPLVGLLLGALLVASAVWLPLPDALLAGVVVAVWVALTGGLHLDGLADCADAWMGGLGDRERTLELLKDPLCGSMAVIVLVLTLVLKTLAVAAVLNAGAAAWLVAVPLLSRASLPALFLSTPYVRESGLGSLLAAHFPRDAARWSLLVIALLTWWFLPGALGLVLLLAAGLTLYLVRQAALRRLDGFTGDVAGALVELVELVLLVVLAAWVA